MFIDKLFVGTQLQIEITNGKSTKTFESVSVAVDEGFDSDAVINLKKRLNGVPFLPIECLKQDDKALSLISNNPNINIKVRADIDGKLYEWDDVMIPKMTLPSGRVISVVISADNIKHKNKRSEYRLFLGVSAKVRRGKNRSINNVVLRDVSNAGVGIIASKDIDFELNEILTVTWFEHYWAPLVADYESNVYEMTVKVVRIDEKFDSVENFIGCECSNAPSSVRQFIARKQRERLSQRRWSQEKD